MKRRQLLQAMAATGVLAAWPHGAWAAAAGSITEQPSTLLALFLRGGADGLNICPPLGDSRYFDARPGIGVSADQALPLDSFYGLHPAASGLHQLFNDGNLAIVHACGLPAAQRSHFEAQAIMEQGGHPLQTQPTDGWLSRLLDQIEQPDLLSAVALDRAVPRSLSGSALPIALASIDQFTLDFDPAARAALQAAYQLDPMLAATAQGVFDVAHLIEPLADLPAADGYPAGALGLALADVGRLLRADVGVQIAAVNHGGWDHHDDLTNRIEPLVSELGQALLALREDLGERWANTVVVVQTEFGRRLAENASAGTDHGHGSVMLVAGGKVQGGRVLGAWPGLGPADLSGGEDLMVTTDYRQVLSEVLAATHANGALDRILPDFQPTGDLGLFAPASRPTRSRWVLG